MNNQSNQTIYSILILQSRRVALYFARLTMTASRIRCFRSFPAAPSLLLFLPLGPSLLRLARSLFPATERPPALPALLLVAFYWPTACCFLACPCLPGP